MIALEQNYRSTGHILRAANHVIAGNPKLFEKKLWSALGDGEPVRVIECDGEEHEAERAVACIQSLRRAPSAPRQVKFSDFAILYRANHQARVFEQKLRAAQIPYKVSGGQSFFDRAEIKDLCAWLRLLVNQDDDPAFLRAVITPKRGIGAQTLANLGDFAGKWKISLFEALFSPTLAGALGAKAIGSLHEFGRYVNDLEHRARQTTGAEDAKALLLGWLKDIGYEQHLHDSEDSEKLAAARWSNVLDFVDWVARRCGGEITQDGGQFESERQSVLQVAQTISVIISLAERGDDSRHGDAVHPARRQGPGMGACAAGQRATRACCPSRWRTTHWKPPRWRSGCEEERRLMYVGITRARHTLVVSTLRRRKRGRETVAGMPSRFIAEMKLDEGSGQGRSARAAEARARRVGGAGAGHDRRAGQGGQPRIAGAQPRISRRRCCRPGWRRGTSRSPNG